MDSSHKFGIYIMCLEAIMARSQAHRTSIHRLW